MSQWDRYLKGIDLKSKRGSAEKNIYFPVYILKKDHEEKYFITSFGLTVNIQLDNFTIHNAYIILIYILN